MTKSNKKIEGIETKTKAHFEAVKDFYKKKAKDVHLPRKIRKEIARAKTAERKGKDE